MLINLSIDAAGIEELASLPVVKDYLTAKKVSIDHGKVRSKDFTIRHGISPVRGWHVFCRPELPDIGKGLSWSYTVRLALGADFGAVAFGDVDKAARVLYEWFKRWLPKLPVEMAGDGLTIKTEPVRVHRVEAEDGKLVIEVTV